MTGEEFEKKKDSIQPSELSSRIEEWAAAVDTSDTRVTFDEPIQNRVQTRRVEDGWSAQKIQMADKLG
jgi:hypothetical protein